MDDLLRESESLSEPVATVTEVQFAPARRCRIVVLEGQEDKLSLHQKLYILKD